MAKQAGKGCFEKKNRRIAAGFSILQAESWG